MVSFLRSSRFVVLATLGAFVAGALFFALGLPRIGGLLACLGAVGLVALLVDARRRLDALGRSTRGIATAASIEQLGQQYARSERRTLAALARTQTEVRSAQAETRQLIAQQATRIDELHTADTRRNAETRYEVQVIPQDVDATHQLRAMVEPRALMPSLGAWGIDARSLLTLVALVQRERPALVLELGSGASTIWLGYVLEQLGGRIVSIEHDAEYAEVTAARIADHRLGSTVELRQADLQSVDEGEEEWTWYAPELFTDLRDIDLILIDGPPKAVGDLSRYPAVPQLLDKISDDAWIVLDDARRPDEKQILRRWLAEHDELTSTNEGGDDIAVLRFQRNGTA